MRERKRETNKVKSHQHLLLIKMSTARNQTKTNSKSQNLENRVNKPTNYNILVIVHLCIVQKAIGSKLNDHLIDT